MDKTPDGWAEVTLKIKLPRHVLLAITQSVQERVMHNESTDANILIIDYDGTNLGDVDVFELFAVELGKHGISDIQIRFEKTNEP